MSAPIELDIPHQLGKAAVRDRLDGGIDKIGRMIPGGADVAHQWTGDTMHFTVAAMGQTMRCTATVYDDKVHAVVDLPAFLGLFANKIRDAIQKEAPKLLR